MRRDRGGQSGISRAGVSLTAWQLSAACHAARSIDGCQGAGAGLAGCDAGCWGMPGGYLPGGLYVGGFTCMTVGVCGELAGVLGANKAGY